MARKLKLELRPNGKWTKVLWTELKLGPNGEWTKVLWTEAGQPLDFYVTRSEDLRKYSGHVRDALNDLNKYATKYMTPDGKFEAAADPRWATYSKIRTRLETAGRALRTTLFPTHSPDCGAAAAAVVARLGDLAQGTPLEVGCSDPEVTIPTGFVFEGEPSLHNTAPSLADFAQFWLSRFQISVTIGGGGRPIPETTGDSADFRALYACDREELELTEPYLGEYNKKLQKLFDLEVKKWNDWRSAQLAWRKIGNGDSVMFVVAHSDGDYLSIGGIRQDSGTFAQSFKRDSRGRMTLYILNACNSASGGGGSTLLSELAGPGSWGVIGAEAEVQNAHAVRCGARVMWDLCANNKTLGDAFDAMQRDPDLFPLNLFYSCYAARQFQLKAPLHSLREAA